jgi:hypothetical protein
VIWGAASSAVLNVRKLKFWLQASFEPNLCTSYSEFWNFEIPLKTQESKKIEISFENFQKMLDGSKIFKNLVKDAFWEFHSELFSDLEKSKFSLRKSWIFLEKRSKFFLSPSGKKLESWNYAWICFARSNIKLDTQILNFLEFA